MESASAIPGDWLSQNELAELSGCKTKPSQRQWLDATEIPYLVARTGHLRVHRQALAQRMGAVQPGADAGSVVPQPAGALPNFDAIS